MALPASPDLEAHPRGSGQPATATSYGVGAQAHPRGGDTAHAAGVTNPVSTAQKVLHPSS